MEFHFCDPCDKSFTGIAPYRDHLASAKHKKKMMSMELEQHATCSSTVDPTQQFSDPSIVARGASFWCNICKLDLNGPEQVQGHVRGSKHLKQKLNRPLDGKIDPGNEIPGDLSKMKLGSSPKGGIDFYSDFKFSFHGVSIEKVLNDVKVFGVNDPIKF